jgi:hypothetical protein
MPLRPRRLPSSDRTPSSNTRPRYRQLWRVSRSIPLHQQWQVRQWVALTQCWGGRTTLKTTSSTLEAMQRGISFEEFPTFRDVVLITRRLGFRYPWIDSLCIIQDSEDDWASEASKIGLVYKHAAMSIPANLASNCHEGILQNRDIDRVIVVPYVRSKTNYTGNLQIKCNANPEYTLAFSQLNTTMTIQANVVGFSRRIFFRLGLCFSQNGGSGGFATGRI